MNNPDSKYQQWPRVMHDRPSWVLSGGGALGAYEVGVIQYVSSRILPQINFEGFGHIVGTSVGAINGAFLAATAEDPASGAERMAKTWRSLELQRILPISGFKLASRMLRPTRNPALGKGAIADPSALTKTVVQSIPWMQKRRNFSRRMYGSLAMAATRIVDGRSVIFYETHAEKELSWPADYFSVGERHTIGPNHVLCSSSFPFVFPPGRMQDVIYTDGGIRYNTPLGPAFRLGARRMIVICLDNANFSHAPNQAREAAFGSPLYLAGKMLGALLVDQADLEIKRAQMFNRLLNQGKQLYGDEFIEQFATVTRSTRGSAIHPSRIAELRPSEDTSAIARAAAKRILKRRTLTTVQRIMLSRLSEDVDSELLSVMLLDGEFTGELIRLGMDDARSRHDEIVDVLTGDIHAEYLPTLPLTPKP